MTVSRADKKLARVLRRMVQQNCALALQGDGSYAAQLDGKVCARLSAAEAKRACSSGLVDVWADQSLHANPQSETWLARFDAPVREAAFALQHRDMQCVSVIDPDGRIFSADKNMAESPLAWLRLHKGSNNAPFLSAAEYAAGERFRADYARSSLSQKLCANWEAPARSGTASGPRNPVLDAADSALAAKDRVMKAMDALGPGLNDIIFGMCIRETSLEALERARKWPRRTAKVVLKLALDRLARHYGLLR